MIQVISMSLNITGGDLEFIAKIENSDFGASVRNMEADLKRLTQTANQQSEAMEGVAQKAALAVGSYLSVSTATNFLSQLVNVRGEFQKIEAVLTNSLGSNALAKSALGMISTYAAKTPFQLTEVANAYVKLVNQGFKPTSTELTNLGDLAASTGKSFDQLSEAILDAQTNQFERLKEFGIKASKEGDQVKFTFKGVQTTVGDTSEAIQKYIVGLGNLQGVSGSTAAISATLVGQISNLKDAYDAMLNEIGQGSEGAITTAISGVSYLVENYQKVIDATKVLIVTYGTYRAALVANTLLQSGMTAAELLHYGALVVVEKAQKLLNLTMLANPYALMAAAIAAVVASMIVFDNEATNIKSKSNLLADAQKNVADNFAETQAKIKPYLEALKGANVTEQDRLNIYEKIKAIDPQILKGLDAKTLSYDKLSKNVNIYLDNLRKQIELEANKGALTASIQQEREMDKQIKSAQKTASEIAKIRNSGPSLMGVSTFGDGSKEAEYINKLKSDLKAQQNISKELADGQLEIEKTLSAPGANSSSKGKLAQIDAAIAVEKKLQAEQSNTHADYLSHQKEIDRLELQRQQIAGQTTAQIKAQHTEENKLNAILEKRKGLLNDLGTLHQDSIQSGLTKEASEVDKINEKYDKALIKIREFNEENKNKKGVKQISAAEINQVGSDRFTEINNADLRQNAEQYKKELDHQKDIFSQYEDAKKQISVDRANEMFAGQLKGFSSYISYLRTEHNKLVSAVESGGYDIGIDAKLKANSEQIVEAEKVASKVAYDEFAKLLTATQTYSDKKLQIEKQYQKDVALAQKQFKGQDLQDRLRLLKEGRALDLTGLDNNLARQSELYQNLNRDVIRYTKDQLKERLDLLKQYLKDGYIIEKDGNKTIITPQMQAGLQSGIKQAQDFLNSTNKVFGLSVEHLKDINKYAQLAGTSFNDIADSVRPISSGLADVLVQLSQVANLTASAATAAEGFATGDYASAISGSIGVLSGLFKVFAQSKTTAEQAKKDIANFNEAIAAGELDINIAYRERLRIQKDINDLKLDGIKKEQELLATEKQQSQGDFDRILAQIQGEDFVSGEHSKKKKSLIGGLVGYLTGFGSTTSVEKEYSSLAGKSYDDLNKLFQSGQLEGKTKDLFTQLQKLKQEGADIDAAIEQAKADAQQIYTGTTAGNITDSIAEGFANGFTSVEQFATKTEDIVRQAMLNALKYQALEGPIKKIYEQFAIDAQSGGGLDTTEVSNFTESINKTISDAALFAEQIQKATGVSLDNATQSNQNSLSGAIKGITAQQADLLAGQMGGLRLTALDQLHVAQSSLRNLQNIDNNTAAAVRIMSDYYRKWDTIGGLKVTVS